MFTEGLDKSAVRWAREVSFSCNPYYFALSLFLFSIFLYLGLFLLNFALLGFDCLVYTAV